MSANLDQLGKILALADGGATEGERAAFMQKAEALGAILGVELAVARAHHADKSKRETPEKRRIKVGDERSRSNAYMVELFCAIAHPHDVITTVGWRNLYVFAYGMPSDLDIVEALYGVTAVQMVADADKALRRGMQKTAGRYGDAVDGRVYRAHFYNGFRSRLLSRLWIARRDAIRDVGGPDGSTGTEIVLRDKAKEVEEFYEDEKKHWGRMGTWKAPERNDYVGDAVRQGSASAARADLNLTQGVAGARRRGSLGK